MQTRRGDLEALLRTRREDQERIEAETASELADGAKLEEVAEKLAAAEREVKALTLALETLDRNAEALRQREVEERWNADQTRLFDIDKQMDTALADLLKAAEAYAAAGRRVSELRQSADTIMGDWEVYRRNGGATHRRKHHNTSFAPSQGDAAVARVRETIKFAEAQEVTPANFIAAAVTKAKAAVAPARKVVEGWGV